MARHAPARTQVHVSAHEVGHELRSTRVEADHVQHSGVVQIDDAETVRHHSHHDQLRGGRGEGRDKACCGGSGLRAGVLYLSGTKAGATLDYDRVFPAMIGDAVTIGLLFFLGFLGLAGGVLTIVRYWLVEGTLDGVVAVGALGGLLVLTAAAVKTASPALIFIWIVVMIGGTLLIPFIASQSERGDLKRLREEELARYRRAVEENPQFAAAWREMAEACMRLNRYDDAIAAYKEAIRLNPPDVQKLRRRLNAALEYRAGMPRVATVICDQCGQETPKAKVCLRCGAPLELTFLDWILQRENLMEVLRPTVIITAGAVATLAVFAALPVAVKAVVIAIAAIVGGLLLWRMVQDI